jgi:hypothetical protein
MKTLAINRAGVFIIFKGDFFTKIGNVEIKGHTILAPMAGVAEGHGDGGTWGRRDMGTEGHGERDKGTKGQGDGGIDTKRLM